MSLPGPLLGVVSLVFAGRSYGYGWGRRRVGRGEDMVGKEDGRGRGSVRVRVDGRRERGEKCMGRVGGEGKGWVG